VRILLGEAWRGLRSEPAAALLSVIIVGLALYIPSTLYLAAQAGEQYSRQIRAQVKLRAYLKEAADGPFDGLVRQLETLGSVRSATYMSREELLAELEADLGEGLLEGLPGNPLPRAIDIRVWPEAASEVQLDSLAHTVELFPDVEEVVYGRVWAHRADRFFTDLQFFLGLITALLALLVLAIAANTIRLIIRTRREAIGVWLLLGASPLYARMPYYIEGATAGLAGGLVTLSLLYATQTWLSRYVPAFNFFTSLELAVFLLLAIAMALVGAVLAARRQIVPL
jgi:cell division transport system permease protein